MAQETGRLFIGPLELPKDTIHRLSGGSTKTRYRRLWPRGPREPLKSTSLHYDADPMLTHRGRRAERARFWYDRNRTGFAEETERPDGRKSWQRSKWTGKAYRWVKLYCQDTRDLAAHWMARRTVALHLLRTFIGDVLSDLGEEPDLVWSETAGASG